MSTQGILYNIQRMSVHDGPGLRTTVFFKGCPLRCLWCSNPESQRLTPQLMLFHALCSGCGACMNVCKTGAVIKSGDLFDRDFSLCNSCGECAAQCPTTASSMSGKNYTVDEVMTIIRKDAAFYNNSDGGVTFSGGECTMQGEFLMALIEACQKNGLHTCVDTCGQTDHDFFLQLLQKADLFLFDIKQMDSERHKELTGVGNSCILRNLKTALALCPEKMRIRIPLMQGLNDSEESIAAIAALLKPYNVNHVDILPCHAFGSSKCDALNWKQPTMVEYTPDVLHSVLESFAAHGLEVESPRDRLRPI